MYLLRTKFFNFFFVKRLINVFLYGSENFTLSTIVEILSNAIKIVKATKHFDNLLLNTN